MLDYEKLDVYQCAVQHLAFVFEALKKVPRGHAALTYQWRRAATSIPMNIAEAVGKLTAPDRINKYAIARGEAMECGAIIDVIRLLGCVPESDLAGGKELLERIVRMLTKLSHQA